MRKNPTPLAVLLAITTSSAAEAPAPQAVPETSPSTQPAPSSLLVSGGLEELLASRPAINEALTLEEAVAVALRESPVVRGAAEEVELALARLNAARAERRPVLSANTFLSGGSIGNIAESPPLPVARMVMGLPPGAYFDQNLMLMAPLYTGGRLKTLVRQAEALRNASQSELEGQRQEIALLTRASYREVQARRALVEVQRARLDANLEQLRLDRIRAEEGKIPPFFVLRQEAEVAAVRQELTNAERDVELALLQIKTVMGISPASDIRVPGVLEYQPSADFIARLGGGAPLAGGINPDRSPGTAAQYVRPPATALPGAALPDAAPSATSPKTPAPSTGSTAPGASVRGSEVPGVAAPVAPPADVGRDPVAPDAPAPATSSAVPAPDGAARDGAAAGSSGSGAAVADMGRISPLPSDLGALLRAAERGRPELRAAGLRITGAELESAAISGAYRPQVNAFLMADLMKMRGSGVSGGTTFGIAASVPIFTGGRRSAAIQGAQAERRRLERERERIALEVAQSVNAAYLNLRAAEQNIGTAQAALRAAQEDYRVARIRYEAGKSIIVEVLDALAARTRAESNVVQALYAYNVARDQLLRAVGALDAAPAASQGEQR